MRETKQADQQEDKKQAALEPAPPKTKAGLVPEGRKAGAIDFGRYHALVIGNNAYKFMKPLKTAVGDAQSVTDLLTKTYGFKVTTLIDGTRDEVIEAMDRLRATLTEHDNLLVYYAGHGVLDPGSGRGYWVPIDGREDTRSRWIEITTVTDTLKALNAKHVMLVADSCYSGVLVRDLVVTLRSGEERDSYLSRLAKKRSRTVLTSGGLEPVMDSGGGGHSVFAKAFLEALAENRDEVVEGQTLFTTVRRSVLLGADQTPEYSDVRNAGHEGGDFLFVRK